MADSTEKPAAIDVDGAGGMKSKGGGLGSYFVSHSEDDNFD